MYPVIYISIALLLLLVAWIQQNFNVWRKRGFPQVKGSLPFGSFKGVGCIITRFEALDSCYKSLKGEAPAVGFYSLYKANLLLTDPKLIKNVLVRDFSSFHERSLYHNKESDPVSANTLTLDGQEWKDRRVKMTPMFSSGKMKMMFEIIDTIGDKLVSVLGSSLSESSEQDMRNWAQRFTADNIGNVAFGLDCNCLEDPNSEFMRYGRRAVEFTTTEFLGLIFSNNFPNAARKLGLRFFPKEAGDFFLNVFLQTLEYREKNDVNRNDFVSMLLKVKDQLDPKEMAAESTIVFAAGYETSSTLMQFTLYELALNQDIQDRLREEITTAVEENGGKMSYDVLHGLKYLDMVINESLRKYPPIPSFSRRSVIDYKIPDSDLIIPQGTTAFICTYSLHHDPEHFPDPETFDPERFNEENRESIIPFTFLPFGEGARQCLGLRFGMMQSKMGIAKLVSNFAFLPCDKTTIPMKFVPSAPLLAPQGDMWLKVERIS